MSEWKDFNVDESYNKSMNTPETNAVKVTQQYVRTRSSIGEVNEYVSAGFASKLELQRDEALRRCSSYSDDCAMMDGLRERLIQVIGEQDEAKKQLIIG